MPLGVEHIGATETGPGPALFKPLMPLGVEHAATARPKTPRLPLFKPLMPLGVEHLLILALTDTYS